jgi:hypothetical protein
MAWLAVSAIICNSSAAVTSHVRTEGCGVNRRFTHSASAIAAPLEAGIIALSARPSTHLSANNAQPGHGAVLVELFTSGGCSSCPPADALLQKVNGKYSDAGQLIVCVSEHVTYWNGLGWSDPFSSPAYTERQNAYGQRFHLDSVYTPQIVVNGRSRLLAVTAPSPSSNSTGGLNVSSWRSYRLCQP